MASFNYDNFINKIKQIQIPLLNNNKSTNYQNLDIDLEYENTIDNVLNFQKKLKSRLIIPIYSKKMHKTRLQLVDDLLIKLNGKNW